jgi:hypothetical protein
VIIIFFWIFSYANRTSATVLIQHMGNEHRIKVTSERIELKQKKITETFIQTEETKDKLKTDDKFILARRLVLWYCRDLIPFSSVEKQGFLDFWRVTRGFGIKENELPTRQTISILALDDMYTCLKKHLITDLSHTPGKIIFYKFATIYQYVLRENK